VIELYRAGTFQVPARFFQPRPTEIGEDRLRLSLTLGEELDRQPQPIATNVGSPNRIASSWGVGS
jgi:hypothetical protein